MMNKIPFSQMEGILTQKRDLRKKWCCCTHLVAAKASNTKGFVDFSRSVALSDPITRGLKAVYVLIYVYARRGVALSDPITRGLKEGECGS